MAATDQTYRSQKTLDIVFAVSCILMLLSTFWMFVAGLQPRVQARPAQFRDVETAMNEHQMLAELPDRPGGGTAQGQMVADAKKKLEAKHAKFSAASAI